MANPNNPFGFRPVIRMGGSPFAVMEYGKGANDANAIFAFDLVGKITGPTTPPLPENPTYTLPRIQSGNVLTPGTSLWLGASLAYGAANANTVHPVANETDVIFIAQAAAAATNATHAGLNATVMTGAGNPTTKMSTMQVASAGVAATAGLDLRIVRVSMITPNVEGPNAILEVLISKHANAPGSAGS